VLAEVSVPIQYVVIPVSTYHDVPLVAVDYPIGTMHMCKLWFRPSSSPLPFVPMLCQHWRVPMTRMSHMTSCLPSGSWYIVIAFACFDPRGNSRQKCTMEIVDFDRLLRGIITTPPSRTCCNPLIKTSTLCWTESTTSRSSASLPRNLDCNPSRRCRSIRSCRCSTNKSIYC
jgi:hypothetical protein